MGTLSPQNTEIISDIRVIHNFVKYDFLQIFKKISKEICSWVKEKYFTVLECSTYIFILFEKSKGTIWDFIWFSKHISIWKKSTNCAQSNFSGELVKNRKVPVNTWRRKIIFSSTAQWSVMILDFFLPGGPVYFIFFHSNIFSLLIVNWIFLKVLKFFF